MNTNKISEYSGKNDLKSYEKSGKLEQMRTIINKSNGGLDYNAFAKTFIQISSDEKKISNAQSIYDSERIIPEYIINNAREIIPISKLEEFLKKHLPRHYNMLFGNDYIKSNALYHDELSNASIDIIRAKGDGINDAVKETLVNIIEAYSFILNNPNLSKIVYKQAKEQNKKDEMPEILKNVKNIIVVDPDSTFASNPEELTNIIGNENNYVRSLIIEKRFGKKN